MGKIKKQSRRPSKTDKDFKFRNPFFSEMPLLPEKIAENLRKHDKLAIGHL
jgi:hypothetical protein